jgi:hypothetical protein
MLDEKDEATVSAIFSSIILFLGCVLLRKDDHANASRHLNQKSFIKRKMRPIQLYCYVYKGFSQPVRPSIDTENNKQPPYPNWTMTANLNTYNY